MKTTNRFTGSLQITRCLLFAAVSASFFVTQARLSAAGVSVPIKGSGTSTYMGMIFPDHVVAHGEHRAIISHLGQVIGVSTTTANPPTPGVRVDPLRLSAANGDEIHAVGTGGASGPDPRNPNRVLVEVVFTITGGTGRFENSSGSIQWRGSRLQTNRMPPMFQEFFEISGRISTVGSKK